MVTRYSRACALCGCIGYWADTSAGEVIGSDGRPDPDQQAVPGDTLLMVGRADGSDTDSLYCSECARCTTPAQQFHRLLRVHRITRQRAADACGVSLATVHSWLRRDAGGNREMPERMLRLLRLEMGV